MGFYRDKKRGNSVYRYYVESFWDEKLKKTMKKSKYIGKVDPATSKVVRIYRKVDDPNNIQTHKCNNIKSIFNYGDAATVYHTINKFGLFEVIKEAFPKYHRVISILIIYQILSGQAMNYVEAWLKGSYLYHLFPKVNVSSQNICKVLNYMSCLKRSSVFFQKYIFSFFPKSTNILIDSTALASSADFYENKWGYSSQGIKKNISCLMLVDKNTKLPTFFLVLPGDVPDTSLLKNTLNEIKNIGLNTKQAIFDAGFFSQENIKLLIEDKISFISRVPKNRNIFTNIINSIDTIEKGEYAVKYQKRGLFIKEFKISDFSKKLYGYLILDPIKKAKEIKKEILIMEEKNTLNDDILKKAGLFLLLSSDKMNTQDILPTYYSRQAIEEVFGDAKNNINILPIRTHSSKNMKGFLMLSFMSLACFMFMKSKFTNTDFNINEALAQIHNIKCVLYQDNTLRISEMSKKQKEICQIFDFKVPNK